ncbi:MAG: NADP-dependent oxidoreductase [Pseudomonadota bacterium]
MTQSTNQRIALINRPPEMPQPADFELREEPLAQLGDGEVRVEIDALSIDAFIRTTFELGGHHQGVQLGDTVMALGVGKVIESNSPDHSVGSWVFGPMMAQTVATGPGAMYRTIQPSNELPPSAFLGVLGLTTGLTAWVGMQHLARPQAGETVVVSGAAGAVGTVASQLAKAAGARVIGIAGGDEKCRFLTEELKLAAAIDYKKGDVHGQLRALAPEGVNVFFDNVGGEILDDVLDNIAMGARITICGAISQYDDLTNVRGPKLYLRIAERNAQLNGFTVDYYPQTYEAATKELTELYLKGEMKLPEHIVTGIDHFPEALITLLSGGHRGKMLVRPNG